MKPNILPSVEGTVTNSLALNREIIRAISLLEIVYQRNGRAAKPAGVAKLKAVFERAIDYLDDEFGGAAPAPEPDPDPEDPVDPVDPE